MSGFIAFGDEPTHPIFAHKKMAAPPTLSLRSFMRRRDALQLYRDVVRAARVVPDQALRRETLEFARSQFDLLRSVSDPKHAAWLIAEGKTQLNNWLNSRGMSSSQSRSKFEAELHKYN